MSYKSCAEWPANVFTAYDGSHVSTDLHESHEAADAVCRALSRFGFGGNGKQFPVRVWVETIND